ncbi:hypothetical protein BLNAU_23620 [Blattamonas nauphoetae]|uniref:Uncharacterized protein n=1 Tax=Blattamonas nauphoetae TaxID=2049346 RepID=A0ABQ9WQ67_9EUKA|nr:hypothetical protein BLNAU_23620 [Blattamonas nauphoetae]
MTTSDENISSYSDSPNSDCSAFLNWDENPFTAESEKAVVFRSLVATMRLQPALDDSQEVAALKLLKYVTQVNVSSADAFLDSFGQAIDDSSTTFVDQAIIEAAMKMLETLIKTCSKKIRLALVKADLMHQLIITLHPLSLSFAEAVDIHINLLNIIIDTSVTIATPDGLAELKIKDGNGQQYDPETVLKQVLAHSEKYIWHLCVGRYSIVDGKQSKSFLTLLARIFQICPYDQPTMDFVLNTPVFLTIPSCLTFFDNEVTISPFLDCMNDAQREWNKKGGYVRQMGKIMHRMLRMEGIEDVIEEKLQNDKNTLFGRWTVTASIDWNGLQGLNRPGFW